jgi:hypothetical protein
MPGRFPQAPSKPVADHGVADPLADRERESGRLARHCREPGHRERARTHGAGATKLLEDRPPSCSPRQTARRCRPFRRRAFSTARPALVSIR